MHLQTGDIAGGRHGASALVLDAQPGAAAGQGPRGGQLQTEQRPPGAAEGAWKEPFSTGETTLKTIKTWGLNP